MTTDVIELQEFIEKVRLEIKMTQAAIVIQKAYREYLQRISDSYKNKCAMRIQNQWKQYRIRCMIDRIRRHKAH